MALPDKSREPSKEERAHAKKLLERISSARKQLDKRAKGWAKARTYLNGEQESDGEAGLVRTNVIGSKIAALQPTLYAKAPEISVSVSDHFEPSDVAQHKDFAKTLELALNKFLVKEAKLKQRGKQAVRNTLQSTVSYSKVIYQTIKEEDPQIKNRINDTQDNIERIDRLIAETSKEGGECGDYEAQIYELRNQLNALEQQVEIVVSEGLVIDNLSSTELIILDDTYRDIDDFENCGAFAHEVTTSVEDFKNQFGIDVPASAKRYVKSDNKDDEKDDGELIKLYEVWDNKSNTVFTLIDGVDGYLKEPYTPTKLGERWHPFFALQLKRINGVMYPNSTVEDLIELQDEYNTRRTTESNHKKKNRPVRLLNKSAMVDDEEIKAINNRKHGDEVIAITADPAQPLSNQIGSLPEIPYNPQMYDTSNILFDIELVSNAQDAASGAIRQAKTATEAEIASMGQQSRSSENLDVVEDWLTEMAEYSAQLLLLNMTAEQIKSHFGMSAVWPDLTKEDLFRQVHISIRAGSTAKPNRMRERDQWVQILPELKEAINFYFQAQQAGNAPMAGMVEWMLDETFRRFEIPLDLKTILAMSETQAQGVVNGLTDISQ